MYGFSGHQTLNFTAFLGRSAPTKCTQGAKGGCDDPLAATHEQLVVAKRGEASNQLNRFVAADRQFWRSAVKLEGSWPEHWKRGLQYDMDSVRDNIRPAIGVFKHPWDDMQVHGGRIVVAESSMDAMTLSYGDMSLAKQVLYGLFADTAARGQNNVPCQNEDGSPNVSSDKKNKFRSPPRDA